MQYEVLGFNQERVMPAELDLIDLMILNYIIQANGDPTMEHIIKNGVSYVWIYHDRFLKDLPILPISEGTLRNKLSELKKKGLILVETNRLIKGSKSYYSISELTMSFRNDIRCHSKMTSDTISNNSNIKTENNTNRQQELFNTDKEVINKEDTYKEKVQKFVDDFNFLCVSLPKCIRITDKRRKSIISILKKYTDEEITEVFKKLEASDFCTGRSGKWRADIDFILREDKFINVLEGKYDNKGRRNNFETISKGEKYRVSAEEKEEMRRAVERGELKEY